MKLERNEIDLGKETCENRNYDTLFGNGLATSVVDLLGYSDSETEFLSKSGSNFLRC